MRGWIVCGAGVWMLLALTNPVGAVMIGNGTLKFSAPDEAELNFEAELRGQDAADFRESIDQSGDGDGTVTNEEVEAFETMFKEMMDSSGDEGLGEDLTVDGKAASKSTLNRLDVKDATGATTSTSSMTMEMVMLVEFPVTPGDSHQITFKGEEEGSNDEVVMGKITAEMPPGYYVSAPASMPSGVTLSGDKRTLTFSEDQEDQADLVVTIKKGSVGKGGGAPSIGVGLALVGLLAVAAHRRKGA